MNITTNEKLFRSRESQRKQFPIWVERYRPITLSDVILPNDLRRFFNKCVADKYVPSLLLYSVSPGCGKSSVAKAICEDIATDYLYINTSLDNGIDLLRSRIETFASTVSLSGKCKVVILDEFDGSTRPLQDALRASIDKFHQTCSFIIICNHINKIIKPIRSRCQLIEFSFADQKVREVMSNRFAARIASICKAEKVEIVPELIIKIVSTFYPDLRKMINLIQNFAQQNANVITEEIVKNTKIDDELLQLILNKQISKARTVIIQNSYDYDSLYRYLFDKFVPAIDKTKRSYAIQKIAEYMYQSQFVPDPEITFVACLTALLPTLATTGVA